MTAAHSIVAALWCVLGFAPNFAVADDGADTPAPEVPTPPPARTSSPGSSGSGSSEKFGSSVDVSLLVTVIVITAVVVMLVTAIAFLLITHFCKAAKRRRQSRSSTTSDEAADAAAGRVSAHTLAYLEEQRAQGLSPREELAPKGDAEPVAVAVAVAPAAGDTEPEEVAAADAADAADARESGRGVASASRCTSNAEASQLPSDKNGATPQRTVDFGISGSAAASMFDEL